MTVNLEEVTTNGKLDPDKMLVVITRLEERNKMLTKSAVMLYEEYLEIGHDKVQSLPSDFARLINVVVNFGGFEFATHPQMHDQEKKLKRDRKRTHNEQR